MDQIVILRHATTTVEIHGPEVGLCLSIALFGPRP